MAKTYSIVALNDLSTLASLLIKFGGEFPLFADRRRVWLRSKIDGASTNRASPIGDLLEPTEDYFLDMAALAAKLHKQLIKHAANHGALPVK